MGFLSILSFARRLVEDRLKPGDTAVDATAGNGVDTLFLARLTGPGGRVHAFDIQETALAKTRERLRKELPEGEYGHVELHLMSHDNMKEALPPEAAGTAGAAMFNLGYLPGADHSVITTPSSTIPALNASLELLRPGGILTVVVYPGHEGGQTEADAVERWAAALPQDRFQAMTYRFINQRNAPPYLIAVEKR